MGPSHRCRVRKPWDGRVRIIEGSRGITPTKLYKKPMASDDCDDICGHYRGDKLMDTLQVDGLKRHQLPSFFPSDPQILFRFLAFKTLLWHMGAARSCTCQNASFPSIVSFSSRGYAVSFNSGRHPGWGIIPRSFLSSRMLCPGLDKRCITLLSFSRGGWYPAGILSPFWKNAHLCCGWFQPTIAVTRFCKNRCFWCFFLGVWVKQRDPKPPWFASKARIEICRSFNPLKRWRLLRRFSNTTQSLGCSLPGREVGLF